MSSELKVDTISEKTSAAGVTIDSVLIKDGNVDGVDVSGITQGITELDQWQLTANLTASADPITTFVRPSGTLQAKVGTGMSNSSGIWTFPSTGYWKITVHALFSNASDNQDGDMIIYSSANNGTDWDEIGYTAYMGNQSDFSSSSLSVLVDITDLSNHKIKFRFNDNQGGCNLLGESTKNRTMFEFMRIGDT
tara:strand:+ start:158 stop:736 length:579 start_codon:yes stop_codon:yes gene_type:complete